MKTWSALGTLVGLAAALSCGPALASNLPGADFTPTERAVGVGIGYGGGLSVDAALNNGMLIGLSAARLAAPLGNRFDMRLLYKFINGEDNGLSIVGILGLWGDTGFAGSPFPFLPPIEGGFGLAYPVTKQLTGRLNLVVPLFVPIRAFDIFGGPAAGLEVGYKFRPAIEGTLGFNGQGNLIGMRMRF